MLETIIAYIVASPDILGAAIVWAVGSVFHLVTGSVLTVAESANCVTEGEFVKAGHYIMDKFGEGVKTKISSAGGIIEGAIANSLGETIQGMAETKFNQIKDGLFEGHACPGT